jgi:effector-binding domain-containing protein
MQTETVQTRAQPMLYVRKITTMAPDAVAPAMAEAFQELGAFVGSHGIAVVGPPLTVYHDYDRGNVTMDIGFPVAAAALGQATGDVKAGQTPSGKALKITHRGPYETLAKTYAEIEKAGIARSAYSWEVYPNDPSTTPPEQLVTEIFMPVQ